MGRLIPSDGPYRPMNNTETDGLIMRLAKAEGIAYLRERGLTWQEIADRLGRSPQTVIDHNRKLLGFKRRESWLFADRLREVRALAECGCFNGLAPIDH